jgi:dUTP pyrophosphatase
MTEGSAGFDLCAAVSFPIEIESLQRSLVPTGLSFAVPAGFELQVRPRSGLALDHGVTILNSPGTIDSDYRGEVKVILINLGELPFIVQPAMRIAQLVVARVAEATFRLSETLPSSGRSEGGFGHTGK